MKAKNLISSALVFCLATSFATTSFAQDIYIDEFEDFDIDYGNSPFVEEEFETEDQPVMNARAVTRINVKEYKFKHDGKEYVVKGNGKDESFVLQAMFDSINKKYKGQPVTVYFPAGEYKSSKKITIYSNMTIEGEKGKTKLTNTKRAPFFVNGITSDHYNYENLKKDYKGNAGSNITIKNVQFNKSRAMSMGHGKNITLDNIHVLDCPNSHAIEINACRDVTIINSTFEGMNLNDTTEAMRGRDFNEFIQIDINIIDAFPHFGGYNNESYDAVNEHIKISNTTFKKSKDNAFPVAIGEHGTCASQKTGFGSVIIENCTIDGATKAAVRFPLVESIELKNNKISNTPIGFEYFNNAKYKDTKSIIIKDNQFNNVDCGVYIQKYTSNSFIYNLRITNNKFKGTNKENSTGIKIEGTNKITNLNTDNNTFSKFNNNSTIIKETPKWQSNATKYDVVVLKDTKIYDGRADVSELYKLNALHSVKKGTKLTVEDSSIGTWKKVVSDNMKGYILSSEVEKAATSSSNKETAVVNTGGGNLMMRSGAGTNHSVIDKLSNGTKVNVISESNGWTKISVNGKTGYVSSQYLRKSSSNSSNSNTSSSNKTGVITGNSVNFRSGANTTYKIIGKFNKGDKVTILPCPYEKWYKVSFNGKTGFVHTQYVDVK